MLVFPTTRSASCANATRKIPRRPRGELFNWRWEGKRELFSLRRHSAGLLKSFCAESRENMSLSLSVTLALKQKDDVPCQAFQYSKNSLDAQWEKALWSVCLLAGFNQVAHSDFCQWKAARNIATALCSEKKKKASVVLLLCVNEHENLGA